MYRNVCTISTHHDAGSESEFKDEAIHKAHYHGGAMICSSLKSTKG